MTIYRIQQDPCCRQNFTRGSFFGSTELYWFNNLLISSKGVSCTRPHSRCEPVVSLSLRLYFLIPHISLDLCKRLPNTGFRCSLSMGTPTCKSTRKQFSIMRSSLSSRTPKYIISMGLATPLSTRRKRTSHVSSLSSSLAFR